MTILRRAVCTVVLAIVVAFSHLTPSLAQGATSESARRADDMLSEITYRIVGGVVARNHEWPWQVIVYQSLGNVSFVSYEWCGGSIISSRWVLTAAHCVVVHEGQPEAVRPNKLMVVEGTNRINLRNPRYTPGHVLRVRRVIVYPKYQGFSNDLALVELASRARSRSVRLATARDRDLMRPGHPSIVTGWGMLKPINKKTYKDPQTGRIVRFGDPRYYTDRLMQVELPLVSVKQCQADYQTDTIVNGRTLCAGFPQGGKSSCYGDSGGPLIGRAHSGPYKEIGIVSFGRGCAEAGFPGVFTRVSAFVDWIDSNTGLRQGAPSGPVSPPPPVTTPVVDNPAGLSVSIIPGHVLKLGTVARFRVVAPRAGYLLLFDIAPGNTITQIYPNSRSLLNPARKGIRTNYVEADKPILVPDPRNPYAGFEFRTEPPTGRGALLAVLSNKPIKNLQVPKGPKSFESPAGALKYFQNLADNLSRDVVVEGERRPQQWSYAVRPYQIVR